jgi:hypothetical protein
VLFLFLCTSTSTSASTLTCSPNITRYLRLFSENTRKHTHTHHTHTPAPTKHTPPPLLWAHFTRQCAKCHRSCHRCVLAEHQRRSQPLPPPFRQTLEASIIACDA